MACLELILLRRWTWNRGMWWRPPIVTKQCLDLCQGWAKRAMAITECLAHISKDLFCRATPSMRCRRAIRTGCGNNNFGWNGTRWDRVQWGTSYLVTSSYTHIHRGS